MAVRKSGLGKGLDTLFDNTAGPKSRKNKPNGNPEVKEVSSDAAVKGINSDAVLAGKKDSQNSAPDSEGVNAEKQEVIASETPDAKVEKKTEQKPEQRKPVQKKDESKLPISKVEPNREQPRKNFDEAALNELAESIKQFGILQPILVQKKDTYYEIIAGERRWRAAKLAGLKEIPAIIKQLTSQEIMEISLIENIQREDLNPIEEALAYKTLIEEFHMKQEELADKVSKSRTAVANSMRLLKLDQMVQQMVIDGVLSTGHARAIISLTNPAVQCEVAQQIVDRKLSVRETEKLVKNLLIEKKEKEKKPKIDSTLDAIYRDLENQLKKVLGTKVTINSKNEKSGKVEIEYYSQDELEKIIDLLKN